MVLSGFATSMRSQINFEVGHVVAEMNIRLELTTSSLIVHCLFMNWSHVFSVFLMLNAQFGGLVHLFVT